MSGAATEGIETLPDGHAEFHHMSMEYMADGENPTGVAFESQNKRIVAISGCAFFNPLGGNKWTPNKGQWVSDLGNRPLAFVDNVMLGVTYSFGSSRDVTHVVRRNLFIGSRTGHFCGTLCPAAMMLNFVGDGGRLIVKDNYIVGNQLGASISRRCGDDGDDFFVWENNIAQGNQVGFQIAGGCNRLPLTSYKNSHGVVSHGLDEISNFLIVEAAVGFAATYPVTNVGVPDFRLGFFLNGATAYLHDATIIGALEQLTGLGFEWGCDGRNDLYLGSAQTPGRNMQNIG